MKKLEPLGMDLTGMGESRADLERRRGRAETLIFSSPPLIRHLVSWSSCSPSSPSSSSTSSSSSPYRRGGRGGRANTQCKHTLVLFLSISLVLFLLSYLIRYHYYHYCCCYDLSRAFQLLNTSFSTTNAPPIKSVPLSLISEQKWPSLLTLFILVLDSIIEWFGDSMIQWFNNSMIKWLNGWEASAGSDSDRFERKVESAFDWEAMPAPLDMEHPNYPTAIK